VLAPSHPDLSKVRTVAGDYHEGDLAEIMGDAKLVGDVVETWRRHGENRPTLCFGVDRAHAKSLQEAFTRAGIPCAYVDAFTELDERELSAAPSRQATSKWSATSASSRPGSTGTCAV
jgi:DNA repair protein RadD